MRPPSRSPTIELTNLPTAPPITTARARAIMLVLSRKSLNSFAKLVATPTGLMSFSPVISTMVSSLLERIAEADKVSVVRARASRGRAGIVFPDPASEQIPAGAERGAQRELVAELIVLGVLEVRVDREVVPHLEAQGHLPAEVDRNAGADMRFVGIDVVVVRHIGDTDFAGQVDFLLTEQVVAHAGAGRRVQVQILERIAGQFLADVEIQLRIELVLVLADSIGVSRIQDPVRLAV